MSLLPQKTNRYIYIFALALLTASLPFSLFMMSIAQFALIINWFLEGRILNKFKSFFNNKACLFLTLLFFIHIAGLLYTTDFNYAFKDIRTKLPLFILPLVIATSNPLKPSQIKLLLYIFIAAVFTATIISTVYYFTNVVNNIRDISRFISHIRFSLMICLSIVFLVYDFFTALQQSQKTKYIIFVLLAVWFLLFLILFESLTGLTIIFSLSVFFGIKLFFSKAHFAYKIITTAFIITSITFSVFYINNTVKEYYKKELVLFSELETHTAEGNPYQHDSTSLEAENGNLIWIYISEDELAREWKKRSDFDFFGKDAKGQHLQFTLIRYLTSKGLRKDAQGIGTLNDSEIKAIEKGTPSMLDLEKMTLKKRINQIIKEYEDYAKDGDANQKSVMQRYEFMQAAIGIIKENFLFGVGTGDVNHAFKAQYLKSGSLLRPENQWRSHNQYLSFFVAFGILGMLIFLISLFYPPITLKKFSEKHYQAFFIIILISMLTEDTLETQAGVTFFAYFNALFLFAISKEND